MTEQSLPHKTLELPPPDQIIFNQLMETQAKVLGLYPLLDLLAEPDDQKETLGERLAALLRDLTLTLQTFQAQHQEMTKAIRDHMATTETAAQAAMEQRDALEEKLDLILTVLNVPID